jgi:MoCo/4Fe-4S cofactor protein with predicted Tat translocation signal
MALRTEIDNAPGGSGELWTGLEQLASDPAFQDMLHREFPEDSTAWADPVTRRTFLTLAGASAALAAAGCSPRPASPEKIYAYTKQPEQMTPGLPLFFATGFAQQGVTTGILAKSREGRPIKIEGNPTHPGSLGSTDVFTQASILNMFDPERSRGIMHRESAKTWEQTVAALKIQLDKLKAEGKAVRVLTETVGSPTLAASIEEFLKNYPKSKWVQYEPVNRENVFAGARLAFSETVNVVYDFTKAIRVVSLDGNFLNQGPGHVRYAHDFNKNRNTHLRGEGKDARVPTAEELNRLYVVESMLTPTGAVADHRLPIQSAQVESFARALAVALGVAVSAGSKLDDGVQKWLAPLVKDLQAHTGKSLVVVGDHQPPAVHAIAHAINEKLDAFKNGLAKVVATPEVKPTEQTKEFRELVDEMKSGTVAGIFFFGVNPVYTAPADLDFKAALAKVPLRVHFGHNVDETAIHCEWQINETHHLETWSDGRGYDGTATISQPLMAPLHGGHSAIEFFAAINAEKTSELHSREIVKAYWKKNWPGKVENSEDRRDPRVQSPGGWPRSELPGRPDDVRWPLRQQWLAPGTAEADLETDVGQRRDRQLEDLQRTQVQLHHRIDRRGRARSRGLPDRRTDRPRPEAESRRVAGPRACG